MKNRGFGLALAAVAVAGAVVLFIVLRDDQDDGAVGETTAAETTTSAPSDDTETTATTPRDDTATTTTTTPAVAQIVIKGGEPVGGVQELEFAEGDEIRFVVESDVADEIHFHGYDVTKAVEAGGSVEFDVPATIPGVFEVELHHAAAQIAEVTVD